MNLAPGIEEVHRISDTFADQTEAAAYWMEGAQDVHSIEDLTYPGGAGQDQRFRLYRAHDSDAPLMIFIHGGGWVGGTIEMNERASRCIANAGWHVASLSYRLAPANPFPAGLDDCIAAVRYLQSANLPNIDSARIAIGGASAGANLSLATAMELPRDTFAALLLYYGVYGNTVETETHALYQNGPGITRDRVAEIYDLYDPGGTYRNDARLAPLLGDLTGLPPVLNVAAEIDVLRSENEALVAALTAAGVEVDAWTEPGVTHGFINRGRLVPVADAALQRSADWLAARA